MLKVASLNEIGEIKWDDYVFNHPHGNYCQLSSWHRIIKDTYGHKSHFLVALKDSSRGFAEERISGVLPLIHMKHLLLGNELVSMPFVDLGGLLADDLETERFLIGKALEICEDVGAKTLQLRQAEKLQFIGQDKYKRTEEKNGLESQDETSLKPNFAEKYFFQMMSNKVRMLLELPASSDELMKSFKAKLRSQIKKPIKEGLNYKIGQQELLDEFYSVFCKNMRDLGSPVHSRRLMENVLSEFGNQAGIVVVFKEKTPLAVSFVVGFNKVLSNPWASSLKEYSRLAPNMLLYWAMLEHACDNGYRVFDFGRSTPGEGTYRFKSQWGAMPNPLLWYEYKTRTEELNALRNGKKRETAEKIWKKLPTHIVNWLGPKIRKNISL